MRKSHEGSLVSLERLLCGKEHLHKPVCPWVLWVPVTSALGLAGTRFSKSTCLTETDIIFLPHEDLLVLLDVLHMTNTGGHVQVTGGDPAQLLELFLVLHELDVVSESSWNSLQNL